VSLLPSALFSPGELRHIPSRWVLGGSPIPEPIFNLSFFSVWRASPECVLYVSSSANQCVLALVLTRHIVLVLHFARPSNNTFFFSPHAMFFGVLPCASFPMLRIRSASHRLPLYHRDLGATSFLGSISPTFPGEHPCLGFLAVWSCGGL